MTAMWRTITLGRVEALIRLAANDNFGAAGLYDEWFEPWATDELACFRKPGDDLATVRLGLLKG